MFRENESLVLQLLVCVFVWAVWPNILLNPVKLGSDGIRESLKLYVAQGPLGGKKCPYNFSLYRDVFMYIHTLLALQCSPTKNKCIYV